MMTTGPKLIPVSVEIGPGWNGMEDPVPSFGGEERRDIFFIYMYFAQDSTSIAQVAGVEREQRWEDQATVTNPLCYPPLPHPPSLTSSPFNEMLVHRRLPSAMYRQNQGAKKIIFTACHLGKLKLAITSPDVISTSPKIFLMSRIDFTVFLVFDFLKKHHLPVGQVKNRIH